MANEGTIQHHDPFDGKLGFALASRVGDRIYVSGMTGFEPSDMSVPEDLEAQMRLAYGNIASILGDLGSSLDRTIEQTVFFVGDAAPWVDVFGRVVADLFGTTPPACTMVGVTQLVDPRYKVEIKVTAAG
jgi:enamine deaminase RidA (YjgF/YER057c/UK114 family)